MTGPALYFRAYPLGDLRRFPAWEQAASPAARELADDTVVYLADDLGVVVDPVRPQDGTLLDPAGPEGWARFCRDDLEFAIPEDLTND